MMGATDFGHFVGLIGPCVFHNAWWPKGRSDDIKGMVSEPWHVQLEHAREVLTWFDCPKAWHWPVIVMAWQGEYMGAEEWMKEHVYDDEIS